MTAVVLPLLTGVTWGQVGSAATLITVPWLAALIVLWLLGLLAHTITLTGAMPGLTHRRALTLSLTGSAVANVLPLGGAAGVALNYRMCRTWGHTGAEFTTYTIITNLWDVVAKFAFPLLALPALLTAASAAGASAARAATLAAVVLVVLLTVGLATLVSSRAAERTGTLIDRALGRWLRGRSCRAALVQMQADTSRTIRAQWARLTLGMVLYTALLFALLAGCLTAAGAGVGVGAVAAGLAVERLLTLAGLTPGGAGLVEVGLVGTLLAFPGSPVGIALGVLLYRALTFALEVPVGALTLGGWLWAGGGIRDGRAVTA